MQVVGTSDPLGVDVLILRRKIDISVGVVYREESKTR
jgi:hypothetical protein